MANKGYTKKNHKYLSREYKNGKWVYKYKDVRLYKEVDNQTMKDRENAGRIYRQQRIVNESYYTPYEKVEEDYGIVGNDVLKDRENSGRIYKKKRVAALQTIRHSDIIDIYGKELYHHKMNG